MKNIIPFIKSRSVERTVKQAINVVSTLLADNVRLKIVKENGVGKVSMEAIQPDLWSNFVMTVEFGEEDGFDYAFCNSRYQVFTRLVQNPEDPQMDLVWLSIKTHGKDPNPPWRDLQRIKNDICGTACSGMEIYPSSDRLVDTSNQYHLWVMRPSINLPFGYSQRDVAYNQQELNKMNEGCDEIVSHLKQKGLFRGGAIQEEYKEYHKDDNLPPVGLAWLKYEAAYPDRWTGEEEKVE